MSFVIGSMQDVVLAGMRIIHAGVGAGCQKRVPYSGEGFASSELLEAEILEMGDRQIISKTSAASSMARSQGMRNDKRYLRGFIETRT
jgi:hypothetical protein